ncbi:MAG: dihydropteroate synthase [Planctomycetota bacterium]|nr:dihydropteroate synthase [Planctomycetota bacterium]
MKETAENRALGLPSATCDAESNRLCIRALPLSAPAGLMRIGLSAANLTEAERALIHSLTHVQSSDPRAELLVDFDDSLSHGSELFERAVAAWANATAEAPQLKIMGVVNVTPDSFSDGGKYHSPSDPRKAVDHALQLVSEGCELLDIGGESTRPGADRVDVQEELQRVIPVIAALSNETSCPISIDTQKAEVAAAAIDAGASMVNDVSAGLADAEMIPLIAQRGVNICLMHMRGTPRDMQEEPFYRDVVREVMDHLRDRSHACLKEGIEGHKILIDPGIGFGKTLEHNLELLRSLPSLRSLGLPLLLGVSRKSFIAQLSAKAGVEAASAPTERLGGTIAAQLSCVHGGASWLRVHDVAATRQSLLVHSALFPDEALIPRSS